jgi:PTH1 family peptidyl-tRNA hydrolase
MFIDRLVTQKFLFKFGSFYSRFEFEGEDLIFLKPQTFMNSSGMAVCEFMRYYKIPSKNLILVFDDIFLPVGKIRIRKNGLSGGHNGVKSVINNCGTEDFIRIRIGVGEKPNTSWDLADWVLSRFNENDLMQLDVAFKSAESALKLILHKQIERAMNNFN